MVAIQITKGEKVHSVGGDLILPAVIEMSQVIIEADVAGELRNVPMSNDTVKGRNKKNSDDISLQLLYRQGMPVITFLFSWMN